MISSFIFPWANHRRDSRFRPHHEAAGEASSDSISGWSSLSLFVQMYILRNLRPIFGFATLMNAKRTDVYMTASIPSQSLASTHACRITRRVNLPHPVGGAHSVVAHSSGRTMTRWLEFSGQALLLWALLLNSCSISYNS